MLERIKELQTQYKALDVDAMEEATSLSEELAVMREAVQSLMTKLGDAWKQLGITGRAKVEKLRGSEFMRHRLNAKALKDHIRARLVAQKFERSRLERAYRHQVNSECWLLCSSEDTECY